MSDESRKEVSCDMSEQLELLLGQQYEALLHDDFDTVESKSNEIVAISTALSAGGILPTGSRLERIRRLNEQMICLLAAKREVTGAELATAKNKRNLNKSYRVYDE